MGWDVVAIGLKHTLPIDDPFTMAREVATRFRKNVKLVASDTYHLDEVERVVSYVEGYKEIEVGEVLNGCSDQWLKLYVNNYQVKIILGKVGQNGLDHLRFVGCDAHSLLSDALDEEPLYEIIDSSQSAEISVYPENVDLDIYVCGRWGSWERAFRGGDERTPNACREWLESHRLIMYERARLLGCQSMVIFSDQGPTELIYDNVGWSADKLLEYILSRQYLETGWLESPQEVEEWREYGKIVNFPAYFSGTLSFREEEFVDLVIDDFSDLIDSY
mgnify:CR=1 FL=1